MIACTYLLLQGRAAVLHTNFDLSTVADVKDLSAKLKLMEAGAEPHTERVVPTDQHIYCNVHVAKERLLGK